MSYRIAGVDVHKKMLAVVVSDVEVNGQYQFERRKFGSNPEQLRSLAAWLVEQEVEEVVMESTAQYWRPVWEALEQYWKPIREKREGAGRRLGTLHLAQAQSNRGRRGRKRDFPDAERLVKRLVARELTHSSADKQRLGHISKQGSSLLRHLLVKAAQAATRFNPHWRRRYIHLAMRRHRSIAKVAMGRRMGIRLYWMWRNGCEYSPSFEFGSHAGQLVVRHGVQ